VLAKITDTEIEFYQGDSLDVEFHVVYEDGIPVDLTGWKVRFKVKNTSILKTSDNPLEIKIEDAAAGIAIVLLRPADTLNLIPGFDYLYDAEIYTPVDTYTFAQGEFEVL
jgi:hypothetical protein